MRAPCIVCLFVCVHTLCVFVERASVSACACMRALCVRTLYLLVSYVRALYVHVCAVCACILAVSREEDRGERDSRKYGLPSWTSLKQWCLHGARFTTAQPAPAGVERDSHLEGMSSGVIGRWMLLVGMSRE